MTNKARVVSYHENVLLKTPVSYTLVWLSEVLPDPKNADIFHTPEG